ncbi:UPF0606 protein KIAA1549L-like [Hypomesus transpacificus]|uniref:UPF0606 protein KIAA1549L-like n=1 Tax=Hypomesus transpacificus TaxID=137520 RepID=UPI001F07184F|nr:UPF0606 protein KIAA1549L-like [Hypomesus transpacificus]
MACSPQPLPSLSQALLRGPLEGESPGHPAQRGHPSVLLLLGRQAAQLTLNITTTSTSASFHKVTLSSETVPRKFPSPHVTVDNVSSKETSSGWSANATQFTLKTESAGSQASLQEYATGLGNSKHHTSGVTPVEESHLRLVEESHLSSVEESHLRLVEESHLSSVEESHLSLVEESHLSPVEESHLSPVEESHLSPVEESHLSPVEESHPSPVEESHLSPVEESHPSPVEESHLSLSQTESSSGSERLYYSDTDEQTKIPLKKSPGRDSGEDVAVYKDAGDDDTADPLQFTTVTTTTVALTTTPPTTLPTTTTTTQPTTTQPTTTTRKTTTTTTLAPVTRGTVTPPSPRTSPPRGATVGLASPFTTTTTEPPPRQCNITERMWLKTVVSIHVRRNRLDSIQRQNLRRGLSQALRRALNDSTAQAQLETVFGSPNMTVVYHVIGAGLVYHPSVVMEALGSYGRDRLIADLRHFLPMVTALPSPVSLWRPGPAIGLLLQTVLRFVGAGDDPRSCRFSQMMEQRLENVFSEAQAKVLDAHNRLPVQVLSVSQVPGSPAVSLVYAVRNGSVLLNGTAAASLLVQLSAELVGYFLFYPPLTIAEPLEYHNLNTSTSTRDFWVITVIQDGSNSSLGLQYQSFASLMEQRLAELFVLAGQQGTRLRRATTMERYTVQMVGIRWVSGARNPVEMTYYVQENGVPLAGTTAAKMLNTVDSQTMALTLGYFILLQADPVVKNPPNNLWIIAAVMAPIGVVTLIILIITAVLCRKNKSDFKADAVGNLNPRAKTVYRRDVGYYHQPVQGFDYAKQHLGQQGGDDEASSAGGDTLALALPLRDAPLTLDKTLHQEGSRSRKTLTSGLRKR